MHTRTADRKTVNEVAVDADFVHNGTTTSACPHCHEHDEHEVVRVRDGPPSRNTRDQREEREGWRAGQIGFQE